MDIRMPPGRLARWATSALWPVAVAVPLAPVVIAVPFAAGSSAPGLVAQFAALAVVLLLGTGAGALLVRARMRRTADTRVSRYESWSVLALALGGIVAAAGSAGVAASSSYGMLWLVDGLWAVVVAAGALVVLPLRALRTPRADGPHAGGVE